MALGYSEDLVSAQYLVNKSMEFEQNLQCIDLKHIYMGLVMHPFSQIYNRVKALGYHQNFIFAQYLVNQWMEFDQILHMHFHKPHLGWDYYALIFANLKQSYGLWLSFSFHFREIA